jgi:HD-GYP domain-containing protein (c-di-GMP phosphodiesterase class II)
MEQVKKKPLRSWKVWVLVAVAAAVDFGMSQLVRIFDWPFFFDCFGAVVTSVFCGPVAGGVVVFLSFGFQSIFNHGQMYYAEIGILLSFVAFFYGRRGFFKKWWGILLGWFVLGFVRGGLGATLGWFINRCEIQEGRFYFVSESLVNNGTPLFLAQFLPQFLFGLADAAIEMVFFEAVIFFAPQKVVFQFPYGHLYGFKNTNEFQKKTKHVKYSVKKKTVIITEGAFLILAVFASVTAATVYKDKSIKSYTSLAVSYSSLASRVIDGDKIDSFISQGEADPDYITTKTKLNVLFHSSSDLTFMYVYKVTENDCVVVFDLDTQDVAGEVPGTHLDYDAHFLPYKEQLVAGQAIDPVVGNDQYGWLVTVYTPIKNSAGITVAYAGVDIDMNSIVSDIYSFLAKLLSIIFSLMLFTLSATIYFTDIGITNPINYLAKQATDFNKVGVENWLASPEWNDRIAIRTNDELQELYEAISSTQEVASNYVKKIEEQAAMMLRMERNTVYALAEMVESRDANTGGHIRRTSCYVKLIAGELYKEHQFPEILTPEYVGEITAAAPLHDVGKIKIPDAILNKPDKLTDAEFAEMKTHTTEGAKIIDMALEGITGRTYLETAKEMALYHHEKIDGKGYPFGLKGDQIPLSAKIMAVADVFDALVSTRSYKPPFNCDKAVAIIKDESGTHFDSTVVQAFLVVLPQIEEAVAKNQ